MDCSTRNVREHHQHHPARHAWVVYEVETQVVMVYIPYIRFVDQCQRKDIPAYT